MIPKKYLSPSTGGEAFLRMRGWLKGELAVGTALRQLSAEYASAKSDAKRLHIGRLIAFVMYEGGDVGAKVAGEFGAGMVPGWSVAESLLSEVFPEGVKWRRCFGDFVDDYESPKFTGRRLERVVGNAGEAVLPLATDMVAFRSTHGELGFVALNDCPSDVLIDEEIFVTGEPPLYFTESSHFISPVHKLRLMERIASHVLAEIGYPPLKIRLNVVFTADEVTLVNREEYEGGSSSGDWAGVEVVLLREHEESPLFRSGLTFDEMPRSGMAAWEMSKALRTALQATSVIYRHLGREEGFASNLTLKRLRELCRDLRIFRQKSVTLF